MTQPRRCASFWSSFCILVVSGALLPTSAVMPDEPAQPPRAQRKSAAPDPSIVKGTLARVDPDKSSVTITISKFDRQTGEGTETEKTFIVAREARILQDDAPAKLADLKKDNPTTVKLDRTTVVSISVDGGTAQAEFRSFNADRNTIVVFAGRNHTRRVYHLLKETRVLGEGDKVLRIQDLKAGTTIRLTLSVEDDNTAVRIQTLPESATKKR